jgi:large subunit ribosomal protein L4
MAMVEVKKYDKNGCEAGTYELPADIFDVKVNAEAVKEYLLLQLSNRRRANAKTKTRAEVRGGGRKPWRQKGTGRARAGSTRSPVWEGGGVAHGPTGKNYVKSMPRKVRRLALRSILTDRARNGFLSVIEDLGFKEPKTRMAAEILRNIGETNVLFVSRQRFIEVETDVTEEMYEKYTTELNELAAFEMSVKNIPTAKTLVYSNINPHDLLKYRKIVFFEGALDGLSKMLGTAGEVSREV